MQSRLLISCLIVSTSHAYTVVPSAVRWSQSTATRCPESSLTCRRMFFASTTVVNDTKKYEPKPPEYPPPPMSGDLDQDYATLRDESVETVSNIALLTQRVKELEKDLTAKKNQLKASQDEWSVQKTSLIAKIASMTNLINDNKEAKSQNDDERERLTAEVELLQGQMNQAMNVLKAEQRLATEIKKRLADVEDAMEFQQMEFVKEKQALQATVQVERKKLNDIQATWEQDKKRFVQERQNIQKELDKERSRLEEAKTEWSINQKDFERQEQKLQIELELQKENLKARTAELGAERAEFQKDRAQLQKVIEMEQTKLREVEGTLEVERKRFQQVQSELEAKIAKEEQKVASLIVRLEQEQIRFESEKSRLEDRIEEEQLRLKDMEAKLANEQLVFAEKEASLQSQLAEEIRVRKIKKRQMNDRFQAIRDEMTALWEGAKRDARKEREHLTKKYETQITNLVDSVGSLQTQLDNAQEKNWELQTLLKEVTADKDKAIADGKAMEDRYRVMVSERNQEIADLRVNLGSLRTTVREKEALIDKYSNSYRQLLGLSIKLTGKRIKNTPGRVAGWFRLGKKKKTVKSLDRDES